MDLRTIRLSEETREKLKRSRSARFLGMLEDLLCTFRPGERLLLYVFTFLLAIGALGLITGINSGVSVVVPAPGGSLAEGIVGPPRFINPLLAISQADGDLTQLVYSGLTRALPDGSIVPDLADHYDISANGTVYTFTLRDDATFHDGTKVLASDVVFTVQAAQNPSIKSPHRADWEGVAVSSPDEHTVVFKLQRAYAPFLENTTLGILPKHLWSAVPEEEFPFSTLNTHPVGSGPYRVSSVQTDSTGAATEYTLSAFKRFALRSPNLNKITFFFYSNEDALIRAFNSREVDSIASVSPSGLSSLTRADSTVMHVPLPRVFGIFFNQGHAPILADASVRMALDAAIDKQALIDTVLKGYGAPLKGPIPPGVLENAPAALKASAARASAETYAAKARDILSKGGWTFDEKAGVWKKKKQVLSFALATADTPELAASANAVADAWRAAGVTVSVRVYPLSEFNTNIIRPRAYDAILFGEVVGRSLDLFAFWHSSQRNDPGLNLAMYANTKADTLLAQARATTDRKEREKLYNSFAGIIAKDEPAIFLYAPDFIYVVPKTLRGVDLGALTTPSERFLNVYQWYVETERVWNFFTNASDE